MDQIQISQPFLKLIYKIKENILFDNQDEQVNRILEQRGIIYYDNFIIIPSLSFIEGKTPRNYYLIYTPIIQDSRMNEVKEFYKYLQSMIDKQYKQWLFSGIKLTRDIENEQIITVRQNLQFKEYIQDLINNGKQKILNEFIDTYNYLQVYSFKKEEIFKLENNKEMEIDKIYLSNYLDRNFITQFDVDSLFFLDESEVIFSCIIDENQDEILLISLIQTTYTNFKDTFLSEKLSEYLIDMNQMIETKMMDKCNQDIFMIGMQKLFFVYSLFTLIKSDLEKKT